MSTKENLRLSVLDFFKKRRFLRFAFEILGIVDAGLTACGEAERNFERREKLFECFIMLAGENLGWRHKGGLMAFARHRDCRDCRDYCFSRADVALKQAVHRVRFFEVLENFP